MKKAKKYIYPFVFPICFFVFFRVLGVVISIFYGNREGYAGLGLALWFIILWIFVATPIFCFRYCKIIFGEKSIFLLGFYNSLVVALSHTGPFIISSMPNGSVDIMIWITLALFGWVALCMYVSFLICLNTTDTQDDNNSLETQE